MSKKPEAWELLFQYSEGELSMHQLRAQLKDMGWTDDEVDDALDDADIED